ncbi:hypothetical protein METSCH_A06710 [Metschnikowia aff. pulcherrima]|uniref:Uncharacterized protein n=1 Tax=Metschnikowia aff. pulcherrima TaxID=2163413 RepID=A0A4P6XJI5_9ASCO|nr:hypothetical protein METSCH_A06710 [Metschnikowia aff. pulcherrima]
MSNGISVLWVINRPHHRFMASLEKVAYDRQYHNGKSRQNSAEVCLSRRDHWLHNGMYLEIGLVVEQVKLAPIGVGMWNRALLSRQDRREIMRCCREPAKKHRALLSGICKCHLRRPIEISAVSKSGFACEHVCTDQLSTITTKLCQRTKTITVMPMIMAVLLAIC